MARVVASHYPLQSDFCSPQHFLLLCGQGVCGSLDWNWTGESGKRTDLPEEVGHVHVDLLAEESIVVEFEDSYDWNRYTSP